MKLIPPTEISGKIMTLINGATDEIVIVSPFNDLWPKLRNCFKSAIQRQVRVLYYVRENAKHDDVRRLGIDAKRVPGLHAKAYLNETAGVVTSLNLLKSSEDNAIEIGYETTTKEERDELREFVRKHVAKRLGSVKKVGSTDRAPAGAAMVRSAASPGEKRSWESFLMSVREQLGCESAPELAHDPVALHRDLDLHVIPRSGYVQLAFRVSSRPKRRQLLYSLLSEQSSAIEAELGQQTDWGNQMMQMKIRLADYSPEEIASWPNDASARVAALARAGGSALGRRIDAADQLLRQSS